MHFCNLLLHCYARNSIRELKLTRQSSAKFCELPRSTRIPVAIAIGISHLKSLEITYSPRARANERACLCVVCELDSFLTCEFTHALDLTSRFSRIPRVCEMCDFFIFFFFFRATIFTETIFNFSAADDGVGQTFCET